MSRFGGQRDWQWVSQSGMAKDVREGVAERLGRALAEAGTSITFTTLTGIYFFIQSPFFSLTNCS